MSNSIKELVTQLDAAIDALQDIQANSSTPLEAAMAIVPPMRSLYKSRDALVAQLFDIAATEPAYEAAMEKLKAVSATTAKELKTHESNMKFITTAAAAVDAVLKVAIAVGAMVVGI